MTGNSARAQSVSSEGASQLRRDASERPCDGRRRKRPEEDTLAHGHITVTSGLYRGRELKSPVTPVTHPMGSREKLALFNMIMPYLPSARVLDAFAGSGALGIEAISRGASSVVFCEKYPQAAAIIKQNLAALNLEPQTEVVTSAVCNFTSDQPFDIIIADPPYDHFDITEVAHLSQFLTDDGIFVLSHPHNITPDISGLMTAQTRTYAAASISIFHKP